MRKQLKRLLPENLQEIYSDYRIKGLIKRHKKMDYRSASDWLTKEYKRRVGKELNIEHPTAFTEKLQWAKMNAMTPEKAVLSDKFLVRKWVKDKIGEEYLIPLLGVWKSPEEIQFDDLPNQFVLKTTNASATNIIVSDRAHLNENEAIRQLAKWQKIEYGWTSFELLYCLTDPLIIAEKYLSNEDGTEINDYKFLCFDGEPKYIWVTQNRHSNKTEATLTLDWEFAPWRDAEMDSPPRLPEKPECYDLLLSLVRKLAQGFPSVRVDFYVVEGRPLFGEMTFSSASGYIKIEPEGYDAVLGAMWDLSKEKLKKYEEFGMK